MDNFSCINKRDRAKIILCVSISLCGDMHMRYLANKVQNTPTRILLESKTSKMASILLAEF